MRKLLKFIGISVGLYIAIYLALSLLLGPSKEDKEQLSELKRRYGDRYKIEFFGDSYLHIRQKDRDLNPDVEAEEIYKAFFFEDFDQRKLRDTHYVYLNIFSFEGGFLFQLVYNPKTDTFVKNRTRPHGG